MKLRIHTACLLGASLCLSSPAWADADLPLDPTSVRGLTLDELADIPVVTVVSARAEPITDAPGTVIVITEQQIKERGYLDLMDVFQDLPGVDVSAYNRQTVPTEVIVRGVNAAYNKIIVLRDGVPINLPATFQKFGRNMPLHDILRIEVLYGPASVVYGSDAAAAVIQLISKEAAVGVHGSAGLAGGSFNPREALDRYMVNAFASVSWRPEAAQHFILRASLRTFQSNGPDLLSQYPDTYAPLNSAPAPYTGRFEAPMVGYNADASVQYQDLRLGVSYTDHTWPSSLAQNPAAPGKYLMSQDSIFRYNFLQPYVRHTLKRGPVDMQTTLTSGTMTTAPESILNVNGVQNHQYQHQGSLRFDHRTVWAIDDVWTVTGGVRLQSFDVVPTAFFLPAPVNADATNLTERGLSHVIYSREGVFALVDWRPMATLKVSGGLALEHDSKSGENVLLPRGGVVQSVFGGAGHIKLLYGEAFESAIPDLQYLSSKSPTIITFPNPDLKSEHVRTAELRYEHRVNQVFSAEIGVFYNRITDLQQIVNLGPTTVDGVAYPTSFQNRNFGLIWTAGGELSARAKPANWLQIAASYALLTGEETLPQAGGVEQAFELAKVAKHKLLGEVTLRPLWRFVVNARVRWVGDVNTRATNSQFAGAPMPGYTNINLNLRAENVCPGLDAHLLLENLADARYYQFGFSSETATILPRVPQPGFRFIAGLTYRL
jgi:outer membrane receptor protein involved in Fe transport